MFTVRQTEEFVAWLDALKDKRAQIRIAARLRQAEAGSLGDWQPIDGEVSEMRVHCGPGYRLYFVTRSTSVSTQCEPYRVSRRPVGLSQTGVV